MITIVAKFNVPKESINDFKMIANILVEESNKEEGCIAYDLYEDIEDEGILSFIEIWKDQGAIDIHNEMPYFKENVPKLMKICNDALDVNLFKKI